VIKVPFKKYDKFSMMADIDNNPINVEWRECAPFVATLRIRGDYMGCNGTAFAMEDADNLTRYSVFTSRFLEIVRDKRCNGGVITARFSFEKRGRKYSIKLDDSGECDVSADDGTVVDV